MLPLDDGKPSARTENRAQPPRPQWPDHRHKQRVAFRSLEQDGSERDRHRREGRISHERARKLQQPFVCRPGFFDLHLRRRFFAGIPRAARRRRSVRQARRRFPLVSGCAPVPHRRRWKRFQSGEKGLPMHSSAASRHGNRASGCPTLSLSHAAPIENQKRRTSARVRLCSSLCELERLTRR